MEVLTRPPQRTSAGVYRRAIRASLERVWENVLDWEHLPYLHRTSFRSIRLIEASRGGWRATVGLPSRQGGREATIEVELDRGSLRYVTRTLAGPGEGTEITTCLRPDGRATGITVEFQVPEDAALRVPELGLVYQRLYARLWDEDEAMMMRRERVLAGEEPLTLEPFRPRIRPEVPLGPAGPLRAPGGRLVSAHGRSWRIVVLDGRLHAHATVCPHLGGPLEESAIEDGCVTCPWHGYRYDLRTGAGACGNRLQLDPPPEVVVDPRTDEARLVFRSGGEAR